jgi:hypothetical protein
VADHPLRPATDHRLGRPLPHQLANRTQAPPQALSRALTLRCHAVLAVVSHGYPPPQDRYLRVTHPSATDKGRNLRPCDLHVLSMPPAFALSQDQTLRFISDPQTEIQNEHTRTHQQPRRLANSRATPKHYASHLYDTPANAPERANQSEVHPKPTSTHSTTQANSSRHQPTPTGAANVSLPRRYTCQ